MGPEVYGREAELRALGEALERTLVGRPQAVFFEGGSGIGKTVLLEAFRRRAALGHPRLRIELVAPTAESTYAPVRDAAARATSTPGRGRLAGRQRLLEAARELLPDWLGAIPGIGDLAAAVAATADALYRRRASGHAEHPATEVDPDVAAVLRAARKHPLVLLCDELERMDDGAAAQFERLLRALADERLLIVGAYRPSAPGVPHPAVQRLLEALLPADGCTRERLPGLAGEAVDAWLAARFPGEGAPVEFRAWLADATGGHPATLAATLDHLLETRAIREGESGWTFETDAALLDLPIVAASLTDLGALHPYTAEVISAASLLGEQFDAAALARLLARDEVAVEDQLALGIHFGVLQLAGERVLPDGDVTTVYRFVDPHTCAALRGGLAPGHRQALERARREPDRPAS